MKVIARQQSKTATSFHDIETVPSRKALYEIYQNLLLSHPLQYKVEFGDKEKELRKYLDAIILVDNREDAVEIIDNPEYCSLCRDARLVIISTNPKIREK